MQIEFDDVKREKPLTERGLDFADVGLLFDGVTATRPDARKAYGEPRFQTLGLLHGRATMVVWTPRGEARRIISMRHAHEQEAKEFGLG